MTGSAMDGEALNAARLANQLVRGSRLTWAEVLQPDRAVIDAANALLAENRSLVDENERLRKSSGPAVPAVWVTPYGDNEKIDTAGPMLLELERIGGAPAERAMRNALENPEVDVKKAALATTEKSLYGKDVVMELIKLLRSRELNQVLYVLSA